MLTNLYRSSICSIEDNRFIASAETATLICGEVSWSANLLMQVTLDGILMLTKELHPSNAQPSMKVTLAGISILSKNTQPRKAAAPIEVIPYGILILRKDVQPSKAE